MELVIELILYDQYVTKFFHNNFSESLIPIYEFKNSSFEEEYKEIAEILQTQVKGSKMLSDKYVEFFESRYLDEPQCLVTY